MTVDHPRPPPAAASGPFAGLVELARAEVAAGLPSYQLAVVDHGELVLDATIGAPKTSRYTTFSVTKGVVSGLVAALLGDGVLDPATPVVDVVPEFATFGKEAVTVDHLLLHTAGFPYAPMRPEEGGDRRRRVERFASWRLDWEPGTRFAYHSSSAHWVLAEVIERLTGQDLATLLHERVSGPLGLASLSLGVADDTAAGNLRSLVAVGDPTPPDVVAALRERGIDLAAATGEWSVDLLLRFNEPGVRAAGVPAAGMIGRAADVARYYDALLANPDGLWDPEVLEDFTTRVRNRFPDPTTGAPANRTRGFVVAGDDGKAALRDLGPGVGPRTFGQAGVGGQIAWADPGRRIAFCALTDGLHRDPLQWSRRVFALSAAAAEAV